MDVALRHRWTNLTKRQTKELNPVAVFTILGPHYLPCVREHELTGWNAAIWEFQSRHRGNAPDDSANAGELQAIANSLLAEAGVKKEVLPAVPKDAIE